MVTTITLPKEIAERVASRIAKNKCIACGDNPPDTRGACSSCYQIFIRVKKSQPTEEKKAEVERTAIAEGLVLPPNKGKKARPTPMVAWAKSWTGTPASRLITKYKTEGEPPTPPKPEPKRKKKPA